MLSANWQPYTFTLAARLHGTEHYSLAKCVSIAARSLVAMDVAGEQQIDVVRNIVKTRLSLDGLHKLGRDYDDEHMKQKMGNSCGPCFHHLDSGKVKELPPATASRCCNSCSDVRSIFGNIDKRFGFKWESHPLCQVRVAIDLPTRSYLLWRSQSH